MDLSCFKAYDVRGIVGRNLDEEICYRIGRAFAETLNARYVILGYDARDSSPELANAFAKGIMRSGSDVLDIGLSGTEEMYWATHQSRASGGISVTASHNPIDYNGAKMVKFDAKALNFEKEYLQIKSLTQSGNFNNSKKPGNRLQFGKIARLMYTDKIISFVDPASLSPFKIVINSGNGAAGPTFAALEKRLSNEKSSLEFVHINYNPNPEFPNGIPNPHLLENHSKTGKIVLQEKADLGIAFDGDFDRCVMFDENGTYIPGEHIVALLTESFLQINHNESIVHDRRIFWNLRAILTKYGGRPVFSKVGHTYFKTTMRENSAIYGGEKSGHHYFRDFAYCDSGMIPWLLILQFMSKTKRPISELVGKYSKSFPSSEEINFEVSDTDKVIDKVLKAIAKEAEDVDYSDGLSLSFTNWRLNLRKSETETLLRLNIETKGDLDLLSQKIQLITGLIQDN